MFSPSPSAALTIPSRPHPSMVAGIEMQNAPAYAALGRFVRPFMFIGGENDPNQGSLENQLKWVSHVPGALL